MDLIHTSKRLTEENDSLENFIKRPEAYIFSSKIRPLVFGYKFGKEKEQIISGLILKLRNIFDNLKKFSSSIEIYYKEIKHSNIFIQKKHFRLAKKFVYNSLGNIGLVERSIKKIIQQLELIKNNQKENQSIFHLIKKEFNSILKLFNENKVLLSDIQGRVH